jgi:hypothetical protein
MILTRTDGQPANLVQNDHIVRIMGNRPEKAQAIIGPHYGQFIGIPVLSQKQPIGGRAPGRVGVRQGFIVYLLSAQKSSEIQRQPPPGVK